MNFLQNIKNYIRSLDQKTLNNYLIGFFTLVLTAIIGIIYIFYSQKNNILAKFKILNRNRLETQEVLTKYAIVQKQKNVVENLLSQDEAFYIGQYFDDLMANQGISSSAFQKQEVITEEATQDYDQVRLGTSISGLDMQQLTELLNTIEQEERIYIEELDIIKDNKLQKIDVNIVIATLESKTIPAE